MPYSDVRWNGWQPSMDGADRFVGNPGLIVLDRGVSAVKLPITLYSVAIGAKAVRR